jgi:hypothetical protein
VPFTFFSEGGNFTPYREIQEAIGPKGLKSLLNIQPWREAIFMRFALLYPTSVLVRLLHRNSLIPVLL